jgi:hypothetical protein
MLGSKLQKVTGWALLIAASGVFWDAIEVHWLGTSAVPDGSLGLIPAYLGIVIGLIGFVFVTWRVGGPVSGLLTALGTAGTLVFWGSYPSYASLGGVGALLLGVSVLFLPGWGRFSSPLWIVAGVMGTGELVRFPLPSWGPVSSFTLIGAALGVTGAFVLWGMSRDSDDAITSALSEARAF